VPFVSFFFVFLGLSFLLAFIFSSHFLSFLLFLSQFFRRAYRRNDKVVCLACVQFLAHLVNQRVAHELLALQLSALLLDQPTNDSVEVCVGFLTQVGEVLSDVSRRGFDAIFERLRGILQEGITDKKTQYTIEKLWDLRRQNFKDQP
ncbi:cell-cycle-control protein (translation regulation), partial [Cystoisospora suis]